VTVTIGSINKTRCQHVCSYCIVLEGFTASLHPRATRQEHPKTSTPTRRDRRKIVLQHQRPKPDSDLSAPQGTTLQSINRLETATIRTTTTTTPKATTRFSNPKTTTNHIIRRALKSAAPQPPMHCIIASTALFVLFLIICGGKLPPFSQTISRQLANHCCFYRRHAHEIAFAKFKKEIQRLSYQKPQASQEN
jgi:hypothetical protein